MFAIRIVSSLLQSVCVAFWVLCVFFYVQTLSPPPDYSVRNATTGSFFAAALAGINPLIKVKIMLIAIMIPADNNGKSAIFLILAKFQNSALTPNEIV